MRRAVLVFSACAVVGLLVSVSAAQPVMAGFMTPAEALKAALKQIHDDWSGLLPNPGGSWGGWDGSDSGITEGTLPGPTPDDDTQWLTFDNVTVYVAKDNTGTPVVDSAGVTYPAWPYQPGGQMYISINRSYADSNLLAMKTVLFHELVHVGQWRDISGHWDVTGGIVAFNGTKDQNMSALKEIQGSAATLLMLQGLMKKKEFSKEELKREFKREMDNLQKSLKKAAEQAKNITGQPWGRSLLSSWFPPQLLAMILMKKFMCYGWAFTGPLSPADLAHMLAVQSQLDALDGVQDGLIGGVGPGPMFTWVIYEAREEKELRGNLLVSAVESFYRGSIETAMNQLDAYARHIEAQREKLGDEVAVMALEAVEMIRTYMLGGWPVPVPSGAPSVTERTPGLAGLAPVAAGGAQLCRRP